MAFLSWPEIESFHNVRRAAVKYPGILGGRSTVTYRGKVKIHGTNSAVQVRGDKVYCQSRTSMVAPGNDNQGFAAWVETVKEDWIRIASSPVKRYREQMKEGVVVFGEWCGPGIQKGVAVCGIQHRAFAVFAAQFLKGDSSVDELIVDPNDLNDIISGSPKFDIANTHVIPWYGEDINVPWLEQSDVLESIVSGINDEVLRVESCDPWVKSVFDIEGTGEGIVYYPVSHPGRKHFSDLAFKAKGSAHKIVARAKPAQVDPTVAKSMEDFAELVLTPARLEQFARAVNGGELVFESKLIGPFIGLICSDVKKESADELEASGLDWKRVNKVVSNRARLWYLNNTTKM